MQSSESLANISAALIKAQSDFPKITRDKTVKVKTRGGGEYEFSYAPLDSIIDKIRPVLAANGLSFIQAVGEKTLKTRIIHLSGEWIEGGDTPILAQSGSAQDVGSGITYARRYSLAAMLGIASEDDDDANRASGNKAKTTASPKGVMQDEWERIPPSRQEAIRRHIADTVALVTEGSIRDAANFFYRDAGMTQEEQMGAWLHLDAKTRRQIKEGEAINQRKEA